MVCNHYQDYDGRASDVLDACLCARDAPNVVGADVPCRMLCNGNAMMLLSACAWRLQRRMHVGYLCFQCIVINVLANELAIWSCSAALSVVKTPTSPLCPTKAPKTRRNGEKGNTRFVLVSPSSSTPHSGVHWANVYNPQGQLHSV